MKIRIGILALIFKVYVSIIFSITALLFFPFLYVLIRKKSWNRIAFQGFVLWSRIFRFFCGYIIRKKQSEPLPNGPFIIAPNHASYLDIFVLHSLFPKNPFLFLGKSEILKYPIIRHYFNDFNIPVFRNNKIKAAKSFILSKKAIKDNWSILIFPEGGIADENRPNMMPFKDGAFKLAKAMDVPILPVTFVNNFELFSDPLDVFGKCRPGICEVVFHPLISTDYIQNHTDSEISALCYEQINAPLKSTYPNLIK